ncbi:MAG: exodeoxyribonuclease VII small subunit [Deltaproteobacteria bacterium]|nr:exodeoxyribonuclease VII small subunit [Deltaproteobacteria bacterium]MBW2181386.1 exodeoxyribonuclease VII small subunit [Deltaproteobacteria bacterium]MBW2364416.1 exodeoxyribonuclease VII small subunit [Deltaproteobacteria bacterium]
MVEKSFEQSLKQLEQIVHDLEEGDLPLEKAIKKFEDGIKLSKYCSDKLDETEKKITLLLKEQNGKIKEKPFVREDE